MSFSWTFGVLLMDLVAKIGFFRNVILNWVKSLSIFIDKTRGGENMDQVRTMYGCLSAIYILSTDMARPALQSRLGLGQLQHGTYKSMSHNQSIFEVF